MFIKLLARLLFGYVRIEVEGYYIERFINICTNNKILIWNLKREKGVKLYLNIGINDFRKLSTIARKTNCKIKILRKKGIPFLLNRYKKRKIFAIFLILVMLIIFISSKYIWNVNISVKDDLQLENIEEDIKLLGISKGVKKDEIDTDKVINELRLKRDDIAWVGIDIEGTTVKINIVKADKAPNIVNNSDYCNIVASKSGVIQKIIAQNGTAVVKVGDTVQKGDILIAGYMEGKYTDIRYVHSMGEVEALVSYQKSKEVKFKVSDEKIYSLDEAVKVGSDEIMSEVQESIGKEKEIVDKKVDFEEHEDGVVVKVTFDVVENIGEEQWFFAKRSFLFPLGPFLFTKRSFPFKKRNGPDAKKLLKISIFYWYFFFFVIEYI